MAGQRKICLATTAYDDPSAAYTFSLQRSREALHAAGFQTAYYLLSGNCHVDDARNSVVKEFLLSDCTDLVFLDADVSWEPDSLIALCSYDADVVGGVYPYRRENSDTLPVSLIEGQRTPDANGLLPVRGLPTGFLRIRRHVLEALAKDADKFYSKGDKRNLIPIIFERTFVNGERVGGDITFCRKWQAKGGSVHAATELYLGHTAKSIVSDSLGAYLRRANGETMRHYVKEVREKQFAPYAFAEAMKMIGNKYGALEDVLSLCAIMGKKVGGPIIETGSGLTSITLAAGTNEVVYCLEHDPYWAMQTKKLIDQAELKNIRVVDCPIKDGWYDLSRANLPRQFALGLNDGPPREAGSRRAFFDHFPDINTVICDDADDANYANWLAQWCATNHRRVDFIDRAALIRSM